jgi:PAS domain S-box-containing protein
VLVLSIWGRGLGPALFGAGLATVTVGLAFPELLPKYGMVSDAAMFFLAAVTISAFSGARVRAEAQRRRVEQQLRASERRLIEAQRLAQVGSWERYFEAEAIYWSDEMFRVFGMAIGEPPHFQAFLEKIHPDDRNLILAANEQGLSQSGLTTLEYRILRPDGEVRFVRSVVEISKDDRGLPNRIAGATQDITEQVKAKAALRESEERFRAIFFQAAVGMAQVGTQGEWLLVNDRLCEILGYTPEELRTRTFLEMTHPEDREAALAAMHRLLGGEPSSLSKEVRYLRKNGTIGWASLCVSLVRDQTPYFVAVVEDITDRVRAERALRESERRLTLVQSVAHLGIWDRDLRTNTIATYGDYSRLHGLTQNHSPLTYDEWLSLVHPADRESIQMHLRESVEQTHVWDREFRVQWPDGSVHWLLTKGTVYLDDAGHPAGMAGVSLDITERKEAEAALRDSEERFRQVFEEGPLGVALVGKDHRFLKVNSALCRMVGYNEAELTQMSFEDITHPEDMEVNRELAGRMFELEIPGYRMQKRYVKKGGDIIWTALTASAIRDAEGLPLYGLAMIEDITETRRAHEEAIARQKLEGLGVLAGGIAHDFNNLLGSILATSELVLTELPGDSPACDGVESIKNVADRAAEIVRQMMAYAGLEKTAFELLDLSELVHEMLQLLKVSISKRAHLTVDLPENLPAVRANATQIRQVVMNLITNASEALGGKEGIISVTLVHVGSCASELPENANLLCNNHLRLAVSDTGCGMTEEIQARIFDPFFTTKFAGRGLGLAAVQGIIRDHGGTINVVSAPGQGSRFEVLLPCSAHPVRDTRLLEPAAVSEVAGIDGTVLVVEDEDALRDGVSKMLRKRGFSVVEAGDGRSGVDLFRASDREIDVVLLDMTLPGMTGREVLEELRRMRPDVKVIVTTAYSQDSALKAMGGQQSWLYIRKPYRLSEVTDLVRNVCLHLSPNRAATVRER